MKVLHKKTSSKDKQCLKWDSFPCLMNKKQQQLVPNDEEIQLCLQALRHIKPQNEIHQILAALYKIFILDQRNQQQIHRIIQERAAHILKRQQQHKSNEPFITLNHLQWANSIPQGEQQSFSQRQITAKVLCSHDSGFSAWKFQIQQSKLEVNPLYSRYRRLSESIAVAIFRKVQNLFHEHCQKIDNRSSREEIRSMFTFITNCNQKLPQEQRNTLINIIQATYGMVSCTISLSELKQIYNTLLDVSKIKQQPKNDEKEPQTQSTPVQEQTLGLQHIWSRQLQLQLLKFYLKDQSLAMMRSYFKEIRPKHASLFTTENLRGQLRKSVRAALRKVKHYLKQYEIEHDLTKIKDRQMQYIMRSGRFVDVRLRLIALYLRPGCEKKEVTEIADSMLHEIENYHVQFEEQKGKIHGRPHEDGLFSYKTRQDEDEEGMNGYKQQELSM